MTLSGIVDYVTHFFSHSDYEAEMERDRIEIERLQEEFDFRHNLAKVSIDSTKRQNRALRAKIIIYEEEAKKNLDNFKKF